jgi:hypothetical protein
MIGGKPPVVKYSVVSLNCLGYTEPNNGVIDMSWVGDVEIRYAR